MTKQKTPKNSGLYPPPIINYWPSVNNNDTTNTNFLTPRRENVDLSPSNDNIEISDVTRCNNLDDGVIASQMSPDVLQLANNMHSSQIADVGRFTPNSSIVVQNQYGEVRDLFTNYFINHRIFINKNLSQKAHHDFLEELKCLFLRVRNPPRSALEDLVSQFIECDLNSAEGIDWLRTANKNFDDFRKNLTNSIEELVKSFKEKKHAVSNFYFYLYKLQRFNYF